nr:cell wall-binding repeat-containing protein [Tetrasphaera sp. F2B08]
MQRWYGSNRYETSALASRSGTPGPHDTVVLASGLDPTLAMSAVPAAATVDAPVLLTAPDRLLSVTRAELARLEVDRVILLGGAEILGDEVAAELSGAGLTVDRVTGTTAVETSLALLSEVTAEDAVDTVFLVAHGETENVLAASITALAGLGRVLLVDSDGLTPTHLETLARLRPRKIVVVAEEGVVGDHDIAELRRHAEEGAERHLSPTPVLAANEASLGYRPEDVEVAYLASASPSSVCDVVTGAAVAGLVDAPMLLVERDSVPAATQQELERLAPSRLVVIGGPLSVSSAVRQALGDHRRSETPDSELDVDL